MSRSLRRTAWFMTALLVLGGSLSVPASIEAASPVRFDLDGQPSSSREAERFHCELLDYPTIHCFRIERERNAVVEATLAAESTIDVATSGYVIAYQDASYAGPSVALTSDKDDLSSIGWNDRITSFRSMSATGRFYENNYYGGLVYAFSSGQTVPNVGDTFNDKFSSFDLF